MQLCIATSHREAALLCPLTVLVVPVYVLLACSKV
jgi:hypothetical protein